MRFRFLEMLIGAAAAGLLCSCGTTPLRAPALRVSWVDCRDRVSAICLNSLTDGR